MTTPLTWHPLTRIFHWLIAIPVLLDFFIGGGDLSHKVIGYIALGATLARLIWGFLTTDQAKFSSFPLGLKSFLEYLKKIFTASPINYTGHNPPASWVYLMMWSIVLGLGVTGFMMSLDAYWGEAWLEVLHERLSNFLLLLVLLHFLGLIFDSWKFKRRTWLGMLTGKK